ncbi:hypothetical protein GCM10007871_12290 [Gluconobacter roseus NBRC 3990]|nr:hypothetical protein AA3990_0917 [Gluconobacter roseus NBRC 3990]GLP93251.1 hypothetical protein GCM10007871_12290 [Gluconobacter roseus NBRC 3990]
MDGAAVNEGQGNILATAQRGGSLKPSNATAKNKHASCSRHGLFPHIKCETALGFANGRGGDAQAPLSVTCWGAQLR